MSLTPSPSRNGLVDGTRAGPPQRPTRRRPRAARLTTGTTVWFTGLSASGKTSVAGEVERLLLADGRWAYLLDGDRLRTGLNADLGFGAEDRAENVRRVGEVARLFADAGAVSLVALISPFRAGREQVRRAHRSTELPFVEVFMDTPIDICERRDPKGLYRRAKAGQIMHFTGIDDPYERPVDPDLTLRPEIGDVVAMAKVVLRFLGRLTSGRAG